MKLRENHRTLLQALADGLNQKRAGDVVNLSHKTVQEYLRLMRREHGCRTSIQLVAMALREGAIK